MARPIRTLLLGAFAILAAGCGGEEARSSSAPCGIAALAGPTALLGQFSVPQQTLGVPPEGVPSRLVVRLAAGPAYPAVVGRSDSLWVVGVEGQLPAETRPGYGVLVIDRERATRGVMLFEGLPVEGAPVIGSVQVRDTAVPLIGIQVDPARFEDPACPFFPDSVLQ